MRTRFNSMLSHFNWTLKDVSEITGISHSHVRNSVSNNRFPRWAKLAVEVFEKMKK